MTYVPDATVEIPIEYYIAKIKEHEAKRLSFNERLAYWEEYKLTSK